MKKQNLLGLFFIYAIILCSIYVGIAYIVFAADVTLTWDANTEDDIAGYKIYQGEASGDYSVIKDCGIPVNLQCVMGDLEEMKNYFFAATAYDTSANESGFSNEVVYTVPDMTPPGAPSGLRQYGIIINMNTGLVTIKSG